MQTTFTDAQLADPEIARSNRILRTCVHCGFCTATCPTYQVLGDELDSPRGRIYLIKDMLEKGRPADEKTVRHIDRCLSCLSCVTTCPSGVDYMHLVDHARVHIERTYRRPPMDRMMRWMLAKVLPYPGRFRLAVLGARIARPVAGLLPKQMGAMVRFAPRVLPPPSRMDDPQTFPAEGSRRKRVALLTGCAQRAINTDINSATIRLLTRHGCDVVVVRGVACCGSLTHHMGREAESHGFAERNILAFLREIKGEGLDAIVVNSSGCGTTMKDYGTMFERTPLSAAANEVARRTRDVTEILTELGLGGARETGLRVAYHSACSLQHGQQIKEPPKALLRAAGFTVTEPRDPHLCCGSAGTYNLLQPEIAEKLKARKVAMLIERHPQVIAAGNIGCMTQIGSGTDVPVVHTVELLDWATGGPKPGALADLG
jgi:glycolate oxidase iron-sulfur subunit